MIRPIATTLSLALFCTSAAWAEDRAASGAAAGQQQDQQSSPAAAGAAAQAERQPGAAAQDADAPGAQPAAGREAAAGGEQDPTKLFVKDMYSGNQFEVQLSQLAAQRAQDDQIKQFARMMVQDHQKANQQLKQIAQSANVQVEEQLDPVHRAKLQKFQQIPASEWGRKYINTQVAAHMMNVLELRYQSQNAQDQTIKQFATQQLPAMEKHLKMATEIATKQAGGEARTAGERESGAREAGTSGERDAGAAERGTGTSGERGTGTSGERGSGTSGERGSGTSGERGAGTSGQSDQGGAGASPKSE